MIIPSDPSGRCWIEATVENRYELDRLLISLIAWGPDRRPRLIGTGFAIAAFGREAIAITAAHNFEEAAKVQRPWTLSHSSALPEFKISKTRSLSIDPKLLRACYLDTGCIICEINFVPEIDIAVFTIRLEESESRDPLTGRFTIDTSIPEPGQEVALLGFTSMAIVEEETRGDGFERFVVQRRATMRRGVISDVHLQGNRVPWPCFETTIPVEGGMSGGPVIWYGPDRTPGETTMVACGLISRDISPDEARASYKVAGCSTMAMLWPCLGLAVHGAYESGGAPVRVFLLELIQRKIISEVGSAATKATVAVQEHGRVTITPSIR